MGHHGSGPTHIVDNDNVHLGGNFSGGISNFNNISATKKLQNLTTVYPGNEPLVWVNPVVDLCI